MSLRATLGYPIGAAAGVVGMLRQIQRWLPRYEWVSAHQLSYYIGAINLTALLVGVVGVFAVGVRADRTLGHRWSLSAAIKTAVVAGLAGFAIGTVLTVAVQPAHNTITTSPVSFAAPLAIYTLAQSVPIGLAGVAGLTASRIHAIEQTEAELADRSTDMEQSTDTEQSTDAESSDGAADTEMNRRRPTEADTETTHEIEF